MGDSLWSAPSLPHRGRSLAAVSLVSGMAATSLSTGSTFSTNESWYVRSGRGGNGGSWGATSLSPTSQTHPPRASSVQVTLYLSGGQGGSATTAGGVGGSGASFSFSFAMAAGQSGQVNISGSGSATASYGTFGGGASAVWLTSPDILLAVAGGGGGASSVYWGGNASSPDGTVVATQGSPGGTLGGYGASQSGHGLGGTSTTTGVLIQSAGASGFTGLAPLFSPGFGGSGAASIASCPGVGGSNGKRPGLAWALGGYGCSRAYSGGGGGGGYWGGGGGGAALTGGGAGGGGSSYINPVLVTYAAGSTVWLSNPATPLVGAASILSVAGCSPPTPTPAPGFFVNPSANVLLTRVGDATHPYPTVSGATNFGLPMFFDEYDPTGVDVMGSTAVVLTTCGTTFAPNGLGNCVATVGAGVNGYGGGNWNQNGDGLPTLAGDGSAVMLGGFRQFVDGTSALKQNWWCVGWGVDLAGHPCAPPPPRFLTLLSTLLRTIVVLRPNGTVDTTMQSSAVSGTANTMTSTGITFGFHAVAATSGLSNWTSAYIINLQNGGCSCTSPATCCTTNSGVQWAVQEQTAAGLFGSHRTDKNSPPASWSGGWSTSSLMQLSGGFVNEPFRFDAHSAIVYAGRLYVTAGPGEAATPGSGAGVFTFTDALPQSPQLPTPLSGFPSLGINPWQLVFASDTEMWTADVSNTASYNLIKYALTSGTWSSASSMSIESNVLIYSVTGRSEGADFVLYCSSAFKAYRYVSGTFSVTTFANAPTGTAFRGITLIPAIPATPSMTASLSPGASPSSSPTSSVSASATVTPPPPAGVTFGSNNLAVLRVGSGAAPISSGIGQATFIDEYTSTGGAPVQSMMVYGANACTLSAVSSSTWAYSEEGIPSLSTNGAFVTFPCYQIAPGSALDVTATKVAALVSFSAAMSTSTTAIISTGAGIAAVPLALRTTVSDGVGVWWALQTGTAPAYSTMQYQILGTTSATTQCDYNNYILGSFWVLFFCLHMIFSHSMLTTLPISRLCWRYVRNSRRVLGRHPRCHTYHIVLDRRDEFWRTWCWHPSVHWIAHRRKAIRHLVCRHCH